MRVYAPTDTRSLLTESVRVIARQRGDVRTRVTARSWFTARFSTRHAAAIEGAPRSAESSHSRAIQSNHAIVAESPSYFSIVHRGSPNLSFRFPLVPTSYYRSPQSLLFLLPFLLLLSLSRRLRTNVVSAPVKLSNEYRG